MENCPKLFILGDNLVGGGALFASTVVDEACRDPSIIELRGWISHGVKVPPHSKFRVYSPKRFQQLLPKWIRRALLARALGEGWVILNFTNFPISRLGVRKGVTEICLFHNAYFMASPTGTHNPIPFYFIFRQIFLRRALLYWLLLFFDGRRTKLVVQTHFMAELSKRVFGRKPVHVGALHVPPMVDSSTLSERLQVLECDLEGAWFYPASAEPHKNHRLLIELCEQSIRSGGNPTVLLTITAKNRDEMDILDSIEKRGLGRNLINIGWINAAERQWLYTRCRGILFLSTFESLGIPLLEARFLGRPILCVDSPLAREILGDGFPLYDIVLPSERLRLANDLTMDAGSLPVAPLMTVPKRIIESYCFDFLGSTFSERS